MPQLPLNKDEIRRRALKFQEEWRDASSECGERQAFWVDFFGIFDIPVRRVSTWFETRVKVSKSISGSIDLFYPGILLIEHKTRGQNLDKAYNQAIDYLPGVDNTALPKYILVCDFFNFRLYDMEKTGSVVTFTLPELPGKIHVFDFISGHEAEEHEKEDPVNKQAAVKMGKLHEQLKANGYIGHDLEVLLVRILFCLFAEDTRIFRPRQFHNFIRTRTSSDGTDLGAKLQELFQHLDTKHPQKHTDASIKEFPYVNGQLFRENIRIGAFNSKMRATLLDLSEVDWSLISPEIFGSLFQSVLITTERRQDGAHYTSEKNILKLIDPLFLNDLWEEFEKAKNNARKLETFHEQLSKLRFLDPACGCGNFLVVTYRELRKLEMAVIRVLRKNKKQLTLNVADLVKVKVTNFGGIEQKEFPARIAEVAMWLIDHQMNQLMEIEFGQPVPDIPLRSSARIAVGENALTYNWLSIFDNVVPDYIIGNPPFIGHHLQTPSQKAEMVQTLSEVPGNGVLDYVSAWFYRAAEYIYNTSSKVAFVATNSITQGEQVAILWPTLFNRFGVKIIFGHQTFKWNNEASGNAAVYCVIIGFSYVEPKKKHIFIYKSVRDPNPEPVVAKNINAYLIDFDNVFITNRTNPLCPDAPPMRYGSKPSDGGHFIVSEEEYRLLEKEGSPALRYIHKYLGTWEYLHGEVRYVIWLADKDPSGFRNIKFIRDRILAVRNFRQSSKAKSTREYAHHHLFRQVTQPEGKYLLVPGHSSESRAIIPFGFFDEETIISNSCFSIQNVDLYHFGVLQSAMHMTWVRYICGRIKSDYRYSKDIVYNNFPWPVAPNSKAVSEIMECAKEVLATRISVGDTPDGMYDDNCMSPRLRAAHSALDKAVDRAYSRKKFPTDADRITFLFSRYVELTQQ